MLLSSAMQILKPQSLSLLYRTLFIERRYQFCVSPMLFFSLSENGKVIPEQQAWKKVVASLGAGEVLDIGAPKYYPEVLMSATVYPPASGDRTRNRAGFRIKGLIEKIATVYGDQYWQTTDDGWLLSEVAPLEATSLSWENAYGGPRFAGNPVGKGADNSDQSDTPKIAIPLPNIRAVTDNFDQPNGDRQVVGFGPLPVTHPSRVEQAGTYDQQWLDSDYPGLAQDHHPAIYNVAQPDQWLASELIGDETIELIGVQPGEAKQSVVLPNMACRAFVLKDHSSALQEISLKFDTLWIFPDQDMGLLISRGLIDVLDSDGLDIRSLMIAYEGKNDKPRPLRYYQRIYELRTNPETSLAHLLHDSQLQPSKTADQQEIEQAEQADFENQRKAAMIEAVKRMNEKVSGELGKTELPNVISSLKNAFPVVKAPMKQADAIAKATVEEMLSIPTISPSAIERNDVDLSSLIQASQKVVDKAKADGQQSLQGLQEKLAEKGFSPIDGDKTELTTLESIKDKIDGRFEAAQETEFMTLDAQSKIDQAERLGRQASPSNSIGSDKFDDDVRQYLRQRVDALVGANKPLRELDLSGADLSGFCFKSMDLSNVLLESADLRHCDFFDCRLDGAVLTQANIDGASFSGCQFGGTNLSGIKCKDVSFKDAVFDRITMMNSSLSQCHFINVCFENVVFLECEIHDCDFQRGRFEQVQWIKCATTQIDLRDSVLSQVLFVQTQSPNIDFTSASLCRCVFTQFYAPKAIFNHGTFDRVQFTADCQLDKAQFCSSTGVTVGFQGADLSQSDFTAAAFKHSNFGGCRLNGSVLDQAGFLSCVFSGAQLECISAVNSNFMESLLRKSEWRNSDLQGSEFFGANTKEVSFFDCNLQFVKNIDLDLGRTNEFS